MKVVTKSVSRQLTTRMQIAGGQHSDTKTRLPSPPPPLTHRLTEKYTQLLSLQQLSLQQLGGVCPFRVRGFDGQAVVHPVRPVHLGHPPKRHRLANGGTGELVVVREELVGGG